HPGGSRATDPAHPARLARPARRTMGLHRTRLHKLPATTLRTPLVRNRRQRPRPVRHHPGRPPQIPPHRTARRRPHHRARRRSRRHHRILPRPPRPPPHLAHRPRPRRTTPPRPRCPLPHRRQRRLGSPDPAARRVRLDGHRPHGPRRHPRPAAPRIHPRRPLPGCLPHPDHHRPPVPHPVRPPRPGRPGHLRARAPPGARTAFVRTRRPTPHLAP